MNSRKFIFLFFWIWLSVFTAEAQSVTLQAYYTGNTPLPDTQVIAFKDLQEAQDHLRKTVKDLREDGYLAASVDSVVGGADSLKAWIYRGEQYRWAVLSFTGIPDAMLTAMNIREDAWRNQPISPKRYAALTDRILSWCENNGYPFAQVYLDSLQSDSSRLLRARLVADRGAPVYIDSIEISGGISVSKDFICSYLGIHQGDLYNESQLRQISKKISELAFVREAQPWSVRFSITHTILRIALKEKKSNQLDGLIGLQPNTAETGKFLLTADIKLALKNAIGYGESLALSYQQLQVRSPRFHAEVLWPYLAGSPLGLEASFDLFKRDSAFRRTSFEGGLRYQLNATDYVRVFYQSQGNRIISPDTAYVKANKQLPENLDVTASGAGIELASNHTDYIPSPRKGWSFRLTSSALARKVLRNDAITSLTDAGGFNYASLFDTVNSNRYQYRLLADLQYYFPIAKNLVLRIAYNGAYISGTQLFMNELYQVGGFRLLRGFDEQSIYASQYHIGSADLRFLLSQRSYFYLFSDNAFTESRYSGMIRKDYPVSLGLGMTLESGNGIFSIALGVGKHSGETFQFRQAKIHFGYVAYF